MSEAEPEVKKTINRNWVKNRMRQGLLQHIVVGEYSDDYLYDAQVNFGITTEWQDTPKDFLTEHQFSGSIWCYGDKEGEIFVSWAKCRYYKFRLKK